MMYKILIVECGKKKCTMKTEDYEFARKIAGKLFKEGYDLFLKTVSNASTHLYKVKKRIRKSWIYNDNIVLSQVY